MTRYATTTERIPLQVWTLARGMTGRIVQEFPTAAAVLVVFDHGTPEPLPPVYLRAAEWRPATDEEAARVEGRL